MNSLQLLDHVADVIMYGALDSCDKCKNGKFVFGNSAYLCTGNLSEWAKCDNIQKEPKRHAVKIPSAIKSAHPFLGKKFKAQTRAVKYVPPMPLKPVKKEGADDVDAYVDLSLPILRSYYRDYSIHFAGHAFNARNRHYTICSS